MESFLQVPEILNKSKEKQKANRIFQGQENQKSVVSVNLKQK